MKRYHHNQTTSLNVLESFLQIIMIVILNTDNERWLYQIMIKSETSIDSFNKLINMNDSL
ncbi:hypothetical protein HanRHA438_Chr17g0829901 [Helianthus annuus]|nr:hypothetical protein HanRHA438_Chr17g0829901 [Helianthus annuus]